MDGWAIRLNIANFERRLSRCSDPEQEKVLRQLLDQEHAKLKQLGRTKPPNGDVAPDQS
jgi:hypothetical protein